MSTIKYKSIVHIPITHNPQYLRNRKTIIISDFVLTCVNQVVASPKKVTTGDILLPPSVKIIDDSQYIVTIQTPIVLVSNNTDKFEKCT